MKKELVEITSKKFKCEFEASCPSIFVEITPEDSKCQDTLTCPTVFKSNTSCIIIGKLVSVEDYDFLKGRIGVDEIAIEIPFGLVKDIK